MQQRTESAVSETIARDSRMRSGNRSTETDVVAWSMLFFSVVLCPDNVKTIAAAAAVPSSPLLVHAPLTLLPTPLDEQSYRRVAALSPLWNTLVDRVSRDEDWLLATLERSSKADQWLRRLMDISQKQNQRQLQPHRMFL
jgi:hypothetical protein